MHFPRRSARRVVPHAESGHVARRSHAASKFASARARASVAHVLALVIAGFASIAFVGSLPPVNAGFDASRASPSTDADAVKSAFVYNFAARHVKWPESAHKDKTSAFVIGVLGDEAFAKVLAATCRDRKCGERNIEVRVLDDAARAADCHILVVPESRDAEIPEIAKTYARSPVLLVASTEGGVKKGAHIGFFLDKSKVRFAAHPPSAKKAGLEISSELLKLARVVEKQDGNSR